MNMDAKDEVGQAIAKGIAETIARKIAIGIALFIGFVIFIALGGVVVQLLWNWLVPSIFGLRALTLWEALGVLALSRILFGGFGRGSGSSGGSRRGSREWWKKKGEANGAPAPHTLSEPKPWVQ
jgi:uncharacterized membrane protein YgcG